MGRHCMLALFGRHLGSIQTTFSSLPHHYQTFLWLLNTLLFSGGRISSITVPKVDETWWMKFCLQSVFVFTLPWPYCVRLKFYFSPILFLYDLIYLYLLEEISLMPLIYCTVCVFWLQHMFVCVSEWVHWCAVKYDFKYGRAHTC